ncbi:MAG: signal recognition particle-docking protein FtsY [Rhodospirillales bacterium]|nr:signal recognition particle-docking protein FtsY [Rhodospirillales bacterium]
MSWLGRLKEGLKKSSGKLVDGIGRALNLGRLDAASLDALEEALIEADLGPSVAAKLVERVRARKLPGDTPAIEVRKILAAEIAAILAPVARSWVPDPARRPHVVLVVGVNGSGKTTTIGKIASSLRAEGKSVMLAAGDTFRAAAVRQLEIWGERAGVTVVAAREGGDPAALAYEALEKARAANVDVLLVDTAGRLHNKADLMDELKKIVRVIKKLDPSAPHDTMLVLDATIGQNALQQVETFKSMVDVDALVVTKLDGSAKGGVLVAIANRFATPTVLIGVGEGVDDLKSFDAENFSKSLLDLDA